MNKIFTHYNTIRNNGFALARTIWEDGFIPNVIYILLRGGSDLGNAIHEWFKMAHKDGAPILYAAVIAHSYADVHMRTKLVVDGWTYPLESIRSGDKILLIDDIFDSGVTINNLVSVFLEKNIPRCDIKVAVHDYKVFYNRPQEPIQPDYWCRKHEIHSEEENVWIHYLSHELIGLTPEELEHYYFSDYPELRETFKGVLF